MGGWWESNIVEPGKLPLLLCLASFLVTFLSARTVTRLIRAGRGPFRDVSTGSMHVHHVVPGIVLSTVGGFAAVATGGQGAGRAAAGVVFGVGIGLVLDEFALVLHLHDVYWSEQGRTSVEAVLLTAAVVGMVLLGALPFGVDGVEEPEQDGRTSAALGVAGNFLLVVVALAKGKLGLGVFGAIFPPVALVAAVRLARPRSPWARRFYREHSARRRRAERRARRHDARWQRLRTRLENLVAGAPDRS
ncbi:hypothetical protein GCM10027168_19530 [Streptomyces capparidis]